MPTEDGEQWSAGNVAGRKHGLQMGTGPRVKRRRAHDWWGSDDLVDSSTSDDERYEPPRSRPRTESPPPEATRCKRWYADPGIGAPLSTMTLNEPRRPPYIVEINDDDMTNGSSYEISPNRVYVHSLDDSDEEQQSEYVVHPHVAEMLKTSAALKPQHEIPQPHESNALIRWQPRATQLPEDHGEEPDADKSDDMDFG